MKSLSYKFTQQGAPVEFKPSINAMNYDEKKREAGEPLPERFNQEAQTKTDN